MTGQHSPVNGNQRMIMMDLTENELSRLVNNPVIREGGNLQGINASCAEWLLETFEKVRNATIWRCLMMQLWTISRIIKTGIHNRDMNYDIVARFSQRMYGEAPWMPVKKGLRNQKWREYLGGAQLWSAVIFCQKESVAMVRRRLCCDVRETGKVGCMNALMHLGH